MKGYIDHLTIAEYEFIQSQLKLRLEEENKRMIETGEKKNYVELRFILIKIKNLIEKIRTAGDVAIRSTFIVGFPGETDEQFQKLYDFIGEYKLNYAGFFAYSKEDGTAAAKLKNQIPQAVKNKRLKNITALQSKVIFENNKNYVGKSLKVLYEGIDYDNNIFYGRPEFCAPEVDAKVLFSSDYLVNVGNFYDVKITGANGYDLVGEVK